MTNGLSVCPFCLFPQVRPQQTAANTGRGPGAWRCPSCGEPQFTSEAAVMNVLRVTTTVPTSLAKVTDPIWDILRDALVHVGGDLDSIIVNSVHVNGELAGSLLSRSLRWYFFRLDDERHAHVHEVTLGGKALEASRAFLERVDG